MIYIKLLIFESGCVKDRLFAKEDIPPEIHAAGIISDITRRRVVRKSKAVILLRRPGKRAGMFCWILK